ncbi:MAG TPA: PfkB family carbohydrate kinase [Chloroflexota bacterium]|nr:PfkB family carbohydrate kinase [Chloroflexota bacterium]
MAASRRDSPTSLSSFVRGFARRRVVVLGDMVADEYVIGRPSRISREAPVLILRHGGSFVRPGGATNAAYNLCSLGADTHVIGVIGDDEMGRRLITALHEVGLDTAGLLVDPHRPTSTKTRIVAKGVQEAQQQIVRIDRVDESIVDGRLRDRLIDLVCSALPDADALLLSDYENGVISQEVIDHCVPRAAGAGALVTVDSHGDLFRFRGVTAATPNQPEAAATLGIPIETEADLDVAGEKLRAGMDARMVLITRGSEGLALYEEGNSPFKLPAVLVRESDIVDPTGAGDTVAAVFTLALAGRAAAREAAYLANVAGGEVVRRLGPVTLSRDELRAALKRAVAPRRRVPDGSRRSAPRGRRPDRG